MKCPLSVLFQKYFILVINLPVSNPRPLPKILIKNYIMDVITIEAQAFKELMAKINTIAKFVATIQAKADEEPTDIWVDNYEVCTFLKVSPKTLQRLRAANLVAYSRIRGKNFYKISEIKRLMENNVIRRSEEHFQDLIKNHLLYAEQRRNIKANR